MAKEEKVAKVEALKVDLEGLSGLVLTDYRGLKVQELQDLRRRLRPRGVEYHVVKNSALTRAAADIGLPDFQALLEGPTAVATSRGDEVELARGIVEELRTLRTLRILGGILGGRVLKASDIQSLATLPSRPQLQATLVGVLQAPLAQLIATVEAPLYELVATLRARAAGA